MTLADTLTDEFSVWAGISPDLAVYVHGIGTMMDQVAVWFEDGDDGTPGWAILMDPDLCPTIEGLMWLAQWVGERLPAGLTLDDARTWIKNAPNQIRGTRLGIVRAAQRKLTGNQTVIMRPRYRADGTADEDYLTIYTLDEETPDEAGTLEDILSNSPADIEVQYSTNPDVTWATVLSTYPTWGSIPSGSTWADLLTPSFPTSAGWIIYTRGA